MFTIRTTPKFHKKRLPILFETWITTVNASNFYLVTDGGDKEYEQITRDIGESWYGYGAHGEGIGLLNLDGHTSSS